MDLYGEFEWRGLVYDATDGARDVLAVGPVTLYSGFDPTAPSLHVGHLLPILALARAQRFGHTPIAVVGGGTGLIGDPSFKAAERALLSVEQVEINVAGIRAQLARFLDFESRGNPARLIDNAEWLTTLSAIEFMRDIGKHFSVNAMMAKESVKRRIESDEGISYTEFSYPLLQAFDFLTLYDRFNCTFQLGGSDQWGNITAGMDLIRRVHGTKAYGLVLPLLMTAAGTKFGKTEAGSVWLDARLTGTDKFYNFWLNTDDRDTLKYLKFFTFLSGNRIDELADQLRRLPEKRVAQRELAREVTRVVHGEDAVKLAEANTSIQFASTATPENLWQTPAEFRVRLPRTLFEQGIPIARVLVLARLASSNSAGARLITEGAVSLNDVKVDDPRQVLTLSMPAVAPGIFRLKKGKRELTVIELTDEVETRADHAAG